MIHDPVKHIAKLKKTVSHPSRNAAQSLAETGRTHRQPAFIICFDVFVWNSDMKEKNINVAGEWKLSLIT